MPLRPQEWTITDDNGLAPVLEHRGEGASKRGGLPDLDGPERHAASSGGGFDSQPSRSVARIVPIHNVAYFPGRFDALRTTVK